MMTLYLWGTKEHFESDCKVLIRRNFEQDDETSGMLEVQIEYDKKGFLNLK